MRHRLAVWLIRVANWLDPTLETGRVPPAVSDASDRVVKMAQKLSASGEYRRHWTYTRLLKQLPNAAHRDVSLAIEQSVRRLL